jgi:hypothetical protein
MLWAGGNDVFILQELCFDIPRHGNQYCTSVVIPFQLDAAVQVPSPILSKFVFFFQALNEVLRVLLTDIFYSKVINYTCECDGSPFMSLQSLSVAALVIAVEGKPCLEEFVCKYSSLWETPNCTLQASVYLAFVCVPVELVLLFDPIGKDRQRHFGCIQSTLA